MSVSDDDSPAMGDDGTPASQQQGRRGQRQLQTRAQLIAGARNVFARVGVAEATIAQITGEANVGFGTFYLHFKTKEDAFHAVLVEGFALLNTQVDVFLQQANEQHLPWEETLKNMVVAYLRFANENRDLIQIMLAEQNRSRQTDRQVFLRFAWRIALLLQRAQQQSSEAMLHLGSIPGSSGTREVPYPLNLLTAMIVAILNRTAIWWLRQQNNEPSTAAPLSLDAVGALISQFIIAGLASVLTTSENATGKEGSDQ